MVFHEGLSQKLPPTICAHAPRFPYNSAALALIFGIFTYVPCPSANVQLTSTPTLLVIVKVKLPEQVVVPLTLPIEAVFVTACQLASFASGSYCRLAHRDDVRVNFCLVDGNDMQYYAALLVAALLNLQRLVIGNLQDLKFKLCLRRRITR